MGKKTKTSVMSVGLKLANVTISRLKQELEQVRSVLQGLRQDNERLQRDFRSMLAETQRLKDQLTIVQGDRDRLTAALETCTRRLASPWVENLADPRRSGWRAEGPRLHDFNMTTNEAEDKARG